MSAFMPVLLWLVQWSHECAVAVVKSVVAVARIMDFIVVGGMGWPGGFVVAGKREDVGTIWVLYLSFGDEVLLEWRECELECVKFWMGVVIVEGDCIEQRYINHILLICSTLIDNSLRYL
jgi:hypothetical protein